MDSVSCATKRDERSVIPAESVTYKQGNRVEYRIGSFVVPSHRTAKPPSQASSYLLRIIEGLGPVSRVLDYGCGRLRYANALSSIADSLTLVDSRSQLDRVGSIGGMDTTVRKMAREMFPNARVQSIEEFEADRRTKFDLALCANVLSAIPSKRGREKALINIRNRLKAKGVLLVANQHSNSFYTAVPRRPHVFRHLDGWIVPCGSKASYYGLINKEKAKHILEGTGFVVSEQWVVGQSNYALARA
jgi:hypothetical protein